jgi:predicted nucleic acid-binding protein
VLRWINRQPVSSLYVTSITKAEILHGVLLMPRGKRRDAVTKAAEEMFEMEFEGRLLAFGADAATAYATIVVARRSAGRPISAFDAQIAAIARASGAEIATRNVDDFTGCDVGVINPWRPPR